MKTKLKSENSQRGKSMTEFRLALSPHFLFLSSGFIGYLPNLKELVADWSGEDDDSDQLFFTKIYIDAAKRVRTSVSLPCPS